ncbi:MAG TPA: hypothetical protein VG370_05625, partial [Chloroflexota bacterium]|nr:hypothetical protein [Chloroflexota bacterium]
EPTAFEQSVDEYVDSLHSQSTLSRERMGPAAAARFDAAVRELVTARVGKVVRFDLVGEVVWGRPGSPPVSPERAGQLS